MKKTQISCKKLVFLISTISSISTAVVSADLNPTAYEGPVVKETQTQRDARMKWWREARFGMFIHWGLWNVAGNQWNGRRYGPNACTLIRKPEVKGDEYVNRLMPKFTADRFDANSLAQLAKRAGMKYAVLTAKHHEGFCLFDSKLTDFDSMSAASGRDLVKEYLDAFRKEDLKTGFYYSLLDWHHPDYFNSEFPAPNDGRKMSRYIDYLHAQARELLTNYGKIDVIWWDYSNKDMQGETWRAKELIRMTKSLQPQIIMNNRLYAGGENKSGDFATPEQRVPATGLGFDWETCTTINGNWGYALDDHGYQSDMQLIRMLVDIVSKGGNLLLNVGPRADGSIPEPIINRLEAMGRWMKVNSESIYGTTASPFARLSPGLRATTGPTVNGVTKIYLHVFDWPMSRSVKIPLLENTLRSVRLLDGGDDLKYSSSTSDMTIQLPWQPRQEAATVLVLEVEGKPSALPFSVGPDKQGKYHLKAVDAELHGTSIHYPSNRGSEESIGGWVDKNEWVSWSLVTEKSGRYRVTVKGGVGDGQSGTLSLSIGNQKLTLKTESSGGWFKRKDFIAGEITLPAKARLSLEVRTIDKTGVAAIDLQEIILTPTP